MADIIRPIAICLFSRADRVLVFEGTDPADGRAFARPLGGGIEHGESARDALAREIDEELGAEVRDLVLLGVLENVFDYDGRRHHEIVFVHDGRFADESLYRQAQLPMIEGTVEGVARWRSLSDPHFVARLVPQGLLGLVPRPG